MSEIYVAAFCLKIDTFEGVVGFTSFDSDLVIEGITYSSNHNIDSFAGSSEINLSVDNGEIEQVLDGFERWSVDQVAAGYLSGNRIELRLFNPLSLPPTFAEGTPIISGTTGKVEVVDGSYKFEVRSISELTNRPVNHKTSPKCVFDLGDSRCKLDLVALGFKFNVATILSVAGNFGENLVLDVTLNDRFLNGFVEVLTGVNAGLTYIVSDLNLPSTLRLTGEFAGAFQPNDTVRITAFCAKDQSACLAYSNFQNFGNIPVGGNWIPGLSRIAVIPDN